MMIRGVAVSTKLAGFAFAGIASVIVLGWAIGHWAGGSSGSLNALNYFTE
jgi:hypothetical protein